MNVFDQLIGDFLGSRQKPNVNQELIKRGQDLTARKEIMQEVERQKTLQGMFAEEIRERPFMAPRGQQLIKQSMEKQQELTYRQGILNRILGATPTPSAQPAPQAVAGVQMSRYPNNGDQFIANAKESLGLSQAEAEIIGRESGFRPGAQNQSSTAFGLGQLTEGKRKRIAQQLGFDHNTTNPQEQLAMTREYIKNRYVTAENALQFWKATKAGDWKMAPDVHSPELGMSLRDAARSWISQFGAHPGY